MMLKNLDGNFGDTMVILIASGYHDDDSDDGDVEDLRWQFW